MTEFGASQNKDLYLAPVRFALSRHKVTKKTFTVNSTQNLDFDFDLLCVFVHLFEAGFNCIPMTKIRFYSEDLLKSPIIQQSQNTMEN